MASPPPSPPVGVADVPVGVADVNQEYEVTEGDPMLDHLGVYWDVVSVRKAAPPKPVKRMQSFRSDFREDGSEATKDAPSTHRKERRSSGYPSGETTTAPSTQRKKSQ